MTISTLITKYQKQQTVVKLKDAYATITNAINLARIKEGAIDEWEIEGNNKKEWNENFALRYIIPYVKVAKNCGNSLDGICNLSYSFLNKNKVDFDNDWYKFYMSNGTLFVINVNNETTRKYVRIYIDINGAKSPNIFGKDMFYYVYYIYYEAIPSRNGKFLPTGYDLTRNSLLDVSPQNTCNKACTGWYCAALIMRDNWQIKDDYPW